MTVLRNLEVVRHIAVKEIVYDVYCDISITTDIIHCIDIEGDRGL